MLHEYKSYICKCCKHEFILVAPEVDTFKGYLKCPYCSSRKVKVEKVADTLKECMNERSYRRVKGALREKI